MTNEIYIVTDLLSTGEGYRYNAVYAFKSMTSVKRYEKYLKNSGEDHRLIVTPASVSSDIKTIDVITEMEDVDGESQYRVTHVFEDYEEACDYTATLNDTCRKIKTGHDIVKIFSHFTPAILHSGWTDL